MRVPVPARIICLGVALTACSGPVTAPSQPTDSPTTDARSSATVAVSPSPSSPCEAPTLCEGPVDAGTYTFAVAGRSVQLELGDGWTADIGGSQDGMQLVRHGAAVQGLSFNGFSGRVYGSPCAGIGASETIEADGAAFMTYLAARDGVSVAGAPTPTTVGGQPALQADLTIGLPSACPDEVGDNFIFGIGDESEFHLQPGETARIWVVDGDGDPIIVVLESFTDDGYAELLPIGDQILASTTISGG